MWGIHVAKTLNLFEMRIAPSVRFLERACSNAKLVEGPLLGRGRCGATTGVLVWVLKLLDSLAVMVDCAVLSRDLMLEAANDPVLFGHPVELATKDGAEAAGGAAKLAGCVSLVAERARALDVGSGWALVVGARGVAGVGSRGRAAAIRAVAADGGAGGGAGAPGRGGGWGLLHVGGAGAAGPKGAPEDTKDKARQGEPEEEAEDESGDDGTEAAAVEVKHVETTRLDLLVPLELLMPLAAFLTGHFGGVGTTHVEVGGVGEGGEGKGC